MGVDLGKIFSKAFNYSLSVDRLLPFFILNIVMVVLMLMFLDSVLNFVALSGTGGLSPSAPTIVGMVSALLGVGLIFFIIVLVKLFFSGAITDNAKLSWGKQEKPLSKSYAIAKKKYWSIFGATVIVVSINGVANMVPYIGWLAGILVSLLFLLIIPSVIISNKKAVDSLRDSYNLFMKKKFDVFIFWLLLIIISFVIMLIFIIPVGIAMLPFIVSMGTGLSSAAAFVSLIKSNMVLIFVLGLLFSIVSAYINVFQDAAKTFFYLSVKKTKK